VPYLVSLRIDYPFNMYLHPYNDYGLRQKTASRKCMMEIINTTGNCMIFLFQNGTVPEVSLERRGNTV